MGKCKIKKDLYVYHISNKVYEDIRPLWLQKNNTKLKNNIKELIGSKRFESYKYEVSAFISPIKQEHIELMTNEGFKPWINNGLYIYEINLDDNKDSIISMSITSHPEQQEFMDKRWKKWYDRHKYLSNDEFFLAKKGLKIEMAIETNIPQHMSLEEFKDIIVGKDWCDMDKFIKLNIEKGSKEQYASYIPHVSISISKPLKFNSMKKITLLQD